jgi:hypothetical protein
MFLRLLLKRGVFRAAVAPKLVNIHNIASIDIYSNMVEIHIQNHGIFFNSKTYYIETKSAEHSQHIADQITSYAAADPSLRAPVLILEPEENKKLSLN